MRYKVIVETGVIDRPQDHEMKAALIIANEFFKSDVVFLRPATYSTPDLDIDGEKWEIKSPLGSGKKTIENNLRAARKQSKNIIVDFSRMKLHQTKALANIRFYTKSSPDQFNKILVITKSKKVIEIV